MSSVVINLRTKTKADNKPKVDRETTRKKLLRSLRAESRSRAFSRYSMDENTPLVELARAAAYSTRRSIIWMGIRFPLRSFLYVDVLDPETGKPLISTKGGIV